MPGDAFNTSYSVIEERMHYVVTLWEAAPWNAKKSASYRLYNAAVCAYVGGNPTECIRRLNSAVDVLR